MIKEGDFVRAIIKEDHRNMYSPHHSNLTYFGLVVMLDDEHLLMKCFAADLEGNIIWGTINRFMIESIESMKELTEDDL